MNIMNIKINRITPSVNNKLRITDLVKYTQLLLVSYIQSHLYAIMIYHCQIY